MKKIFKNFDAIGCALGCSITTIVAIIVVIFVFLCVSSCKTRYITQEIPVLVEHTSERAKVEIVRDTLRQRDSVFIYQQGDSLRVEKYYHTDNHTNTIYRDSIVHDTIPKVVTTTRIERVEVEKKKGFFAKLCDNIATIVALVLLALFFVTKLKK